jgi:hypothetical protein
VGPGRSERGGGCLSPRPVRGEMSTLSEARVAALFEYTRSHRLHALWVVLATTGLRRGEALGLRWREVDVEGRRLIISQALQRQQGRGLVLVEPKTGRSRRSVHVSRFAMDALQQHRAREAAANLERNSGAAARSGRSWPSSHPGARSPAYGGDPPACPGRPRQGSPRAARPLQHHVDVGHLLRRWTPTPMSRQRSTQRQPPGWTPSSRRAERRRGRIAVVVAVVRLAGRLPESPMDRLNGSIRIRTLAERVVCEFTT